MKVRLMIIAAVLLAASLGLSSTAFAQTVGGPPEADEAGVDSDEAEQSDETDEADDADDAEEAGESDAFGATDDDEMATDDAFAATPSDDAQVGDEVQVKSDHPAASNAIVLAPHIGVLFPQLTSDLGTWPVFGLSAGYILPFDAVGFTRPLEIGLDVMYTQPGAEGSGSDPNLGEDGSDYDWELTQRTLILELYAIWRFMAPGEFISAYGHIGPRAYFMEAEVEATRDNGEEFGPNTQTNDEYGLVFGGGADFAVGPGTIYGALEFGWSDLDQRITGDSNTGAINLDVGYRLYF